MSIRIEINNKYVITSDQFNSFCRRRRPQHLEKMPVKIGWTPLVTTQLSASLFPAWLHELLTGDLVGFQLWKQVEQLGQKCLDAFK
jgi:hypothetical protein